MNEFKVAKNNSQMVKFSLQNRTSKDDFINFHNQIINSKIKLVNV